MFANLGISIHALREEGDFHLDVIRKSFFAISIHALREEGDSDPAARGAGLAISIHALREEGDKSLEELQAAYDEFLSTPSARRATCWATAAWAPDSNFYPRPPRGGRHLSAENSDEAEIFLSTPSARRATRPAGRHRRG